MIDDIFHSAHGTNALFRKLPDDVRCRNCGTKLKACYAEGRLYAVKCCYCETVTLVKANNPVEAALYVGDRYGGADHA